MVVTFLALTLSLATTAHDDVTIASRSFHIVYTFARVGRLPAACRLTLVGRR